MQTIWLEPSKVPAHLRGGYNGNKFRAEICERVTVPADAGLWDSGSRDIYRGVRLADGAAVPLSDTMSAPWDSRRQDKTVTLTPGLAVVRHSMSRGKDLGLVFMLRAEDAAPLLPAPTEPLTDYQRLVLAYTSGRKSSYMGKDRYQMARDDHRGSWATPLHQVDPFPTRAQWDEAKGQLADLGLLTKAGAITPAGRNRLSMAE